MECCLVPINRTCRRYVISEHTLIALGFKAGVDYKITYQEYFGLACVEDSSNFKHKKKMIFTDDDKIYQNNSNIFHVCSNECQGKVRDPCNEPGRCGNSTCKNCVLRHK